MGNPSAAWVMPNPQGHTFVTLPAPYGHYHIGPELGRGGFGVVHVARNRDFPDGCVVKFPVCPGNFSEGDWKTYLDHFPREREIPVSIRSKHLLNQSELLDFSKIPDEAERRRWPRFAIAMPRYATSLDKLLLYCDANDLRLPAKLLARWCREIIDGLQDLHNAGYVHRDLKPSNILIDIKHFAPEDSPTLEQLNQPGVSPVISDLGIAWPVNDISPLRIRRTNAYQMPSLFSADDRELENNRTSFAEDIYSYGQILRDFALRADQAAQNWLLPAAEACQPDGSDDPVSLAELVLQVSPDFREYEKILTERSGHQPNEHRGFVGRKFVRSAFENYVTRLQGRRGGVFIIEADAGIGKTAFLTNWAEEERVGEHRSPAAYYFRFRDGRTPADLMPRALFDMLRSAHDLKREWGAGNPSDQLRSLLLEIAQKTGLRNRRQLLFVDGLDECTNPREAVSYLPTTDLPDGIFLIISSRPPQGENYLEPLLLNGAQKLVIDPLGAENLKDLREYIEQQQKNYDEIMSSRLARACGGMFILEQYVLADFRAGRAREEAFLAKAADWEGMNSNNRLYGYYGESWKRMRQRLLDYFGKNEHRRVDLSMEELAAFITAAQDWLSFEQFTEILPWMETTLHRRSPNYWDPSAVNRVLDEFRWLLADVPERWREERGSGYFQFRHQSVRDFFMHSSEVRAVKAMLKSMNSGFGRFYLQQAADKEYWARIDPYGRYYTPRHLLMAEENALTLQAMKLICNLDYLAAAVGDERSGSTSRNEEASS